MNPISVIVITRNEERNIGACLESVRWADEIVVVDAESSDATAAIARRFTSNVAVLPWCGFAAAKKEAVRRTRNTWIFWLDADEQVTPGLAKELQRAADQAEGEAGFSVARRAFFLGKWIRHSGWYPGRIVRLFNKDRASFTDAAVHEGLLLEGPVRALSGDLLHYTDPNLFHYTAKFNRYTSLAANEMREKGKAARLRDLLIRPPWQFVRMYCLRLGFLDGVPGLLLALLSSAYVFTKYAKLWEAAVHGSSPIAAH